MTAQVAADLREDLAKRAWGVLVAAGMPTGDAVIAAHAIARNQGSTVTRLIARELRSLGQDLLTASYEGADGGAPSGKGWPHFDCEDILGEYVIQRAAALEAAADAAEAEL